MEFPYHIRTDTPTLVSSVKTQLLGTMLTAASQNAKGELYRTAFQEAIGLVDLDCSLDTSEIKSFADNLAVHKGPVSSKVALLLRPAEHKIYFAKALLTSHPLA